MAEMNDYMVRKNRISGAMTEGNPQPEDSNRVEPEITMESLGHAPMHTEVMMDREKE